MKTGLSPLYDIEMLIKFCVFLDFVFFLSNNRMWNCLVFIHVTSLKSRY